MNGRRIAFTMEAPDGDHGHLDLSVFSEKIKHFLDCLNCCAKEKEERGITFRVVHLSHSSPVRIECEPIDKNKRTSTAVIEQIEKNLNSVEEGKTEDLSHAFLRHAEQLAGFSPEKISRLEIKINGESNNKLCKFDDEFRKKLTMARRLEESVVSTIDGKLEQINVCNGANTFKIYVSIPTVSSIACKFPQTLLKEVKNSLGRFVSVSGRCLYRPDAVLPYQIEVQAMEVLPVSEELPSLRDLCGIAPGLTKGKTPEQFVREKRDQWDKDAQ